MQKHGGAKNSNADTETGQQHAQYIKALIETIRSPFLVLDSRLRVIENDGA
jgi:hypothetical protein